MRLVYGAGAVAAVSVIAVGLVQPDFAATADQPAIDPGSADTTLVEVGTSAAKGGKAVRAAAPTPEVRVKHVVKYIHLKPGQTPPPGATVIDPGQPTPRIVVANRPTTNQSSSRTNNQANSKPPAAKPPAAKPPVAQAPKPTPKPPVRTRQSGRP